MPGLNGIEATRRIRKLRLTLRLLFSPKIKDEDVRAAALQTGAGAMCSRQNDYRANTYDSEGVRTRLFGNIRFSSLRFRTVLPELLKRFATDHKFGVPAMQADGQSREYPVLITGLAMMLVWAGIMEAFFSQHHAPVLPYGFKIAFGIAELVLLTIYLLLIGQRKVVAEKTPSVHPESL